MGGTYRHDEARGIEADRGVNAIMTDVHFSSARTKNPERDEWRTPADFFKSLDDEFNFAIDAAANEENALCNIFFGPGGAFEDSLTAPWKFMADGKAIYCNPPYSKLRAFVKKAREEADNGATVVMLIPARTDTIAFHEYILGRAEIRFVKGRIKFVGAQNGAPFPSVIVIFRPKEETPHTKGEGMEKIDLSKTEVGVATTFENVAPEEVLSIGGGLAIDGEAERPRAVAFSLVLNDTPYVFSDSAMLSLMDAVFENAGRIRQFRELGIPNFLGGLNGLRI